MVYPHDSLKKPKPRFANKGRNKKLKSPEFLPLKRLCRWTFPGSFADVDEGGEEGEAAEEGMVGEWELIGGMTGDIDGGMIGRVRIDHLGTIDGKGRNNIVTIDVIEIETTEGMTSENVTSEESAMIGKRDVTMVMSIRENHVIEKITVSTDVNENEMIAIANRSEGD
jgi:hypothetical protein